jgi:RNA polymerase sigma-70 factor (ECF subfamily)
MGRDLAHFTDEALRSPVASSDDQALAELHDRFGGVAPGWRSASLRASRSRRTRCRRFLAVWRTADRFLAERAKASTWILTLVHRRAVDLVRRQERRRGEPLESVPEPVASEQVEEQATIRFQRQVVQEALRRLPPEQREALELGYYAGLTQTEPAERLAAAWARSEPDVHRAHPPERPLAQAGLEESLRRTWR